METLKDYLLCEAAKKWFMSIDWPSRTVCACFNNRTLLEVRKSVDEKLSNTSLNQYSFYNGPLKMIELGLWDKDMTTEAYKEHYRSESETLEEILNDEYENPNKVYSNFNICFSKKTDIKTVKKPLDNIVLNLTLMCPDKKLKAADIKKIFNQELGINVTVNKIDFDDPSEIGTSPEGTLKRICDEKEIKYNPIWEANVSVNIAINQFNKVF